MVIVELAGGLGNQMFQYAFGRSIALKSNSKLVLDLRYLENKEQQKGFTYRNFSLDIFNHKASILHEESYGIADRLINSLTSKIFRKLIPSFSNYIKEKTNTFHPEYLSATKDVYLRGYWQNPRYFDGISKQLKEDFRFPQSSNQTILKLKDNITSNTNSVAVHIRRGDYVNTPNNLLVSSPDYYEEAFKYFSSKLSDAHYFIFSDDPGWVKENLELPKNSLIINHLDTLNDYDEMFLMTICRHHIIANSSFSWWGAWLADSQDQIVVAPKLWDGTRRSEDITDSSWSLI